MRLPPSLFMMGGKEMRLSMSTSFLILWVLLLEMVIFASGNSQNLLSIVLRHGTPLYSQVPLPHGMTWLKVSAQSIFMGRKMLPSSLFTIPRKSPSKNSLISFDGFEMLLLIVMGNSKSKSWLRFALTTCLMNTGPI